jgi:type I restriction enzyme S subunit
MPPIATEISNLLSEEVQFAELNQVFEIRNGYTPAKSDPTFWNGGDVPWFRMEDIRVNGRVLKAALQNIPLRAVKGGRLFPANSILISTSATIGEHAIIEIPHLSNQRFSSLVVRDTFKESLNPKFVFYYCFKLSQWCKENTTISSFAAVDMDGFRKFPFPIPSLDLQNEIVRILDKFMALDAELEAELEARKKQFEFMVEHTLQHDDLTIAPLGELVTIRDSERVPISRDQRKPGDVPYYGANGIQDYVADHIFEGDFLLFGEDGSVMKSDGSPVLNWATGKIWVNNHAHVLAEKPSTASLRFLYHALSKTDVRKIVRGTPPKINQENLKAILVSLPPLNLQETMARKLDTFEDLISEIELELKTRRKQYEYYRDQLLTFKEA